MDFPERSRRTKRRRDGSRKELQNSLQAEGVVEQIPQAETSALVSVPSHGGIQNIEDDSIACCSQSGHGEDNFETHSEPIESDRDENSDSDWSAALDSEPEYLQEEEEVSFEERDEDDPDEPHMLSDFSAGEESSSDDEQGQPFGFDSTTLDGAVVPLAALTKRELLLLDLGMLSRHKLTYECLIDGFIIKNTMFGMKALPTSKKELWKVLGRKNSGMVFHVYCSACGAYIGRKKDLGDYAECRSENCTFKIATKKAKVFVTLSLRKQLEAFLAIPGIAELLKYRETRDKHGYDPNTVQDVFDGQRYKRLQADGVLGPHDFTYVFNLDGAKMRKGGKLTTTPVFARINELPPHLRQKFMFLVAVCVDKAEPKMTSFLRPLATQLNSLSRRGIRWKPFGEEEVESKFHPYCFCLDGKARWQALNMTSHNGYFGCTYCLLEGIKVGNTMRWPFEEHCQERTSEGMKAAMREAKANAPVDGHRGPSALMLVNNLDLREANAVDDLHVLYECAAPHVTNLILKETENRENEHMATVTLYNIIDNRMKAIFTPCNVARKPGTCSIIKRTQFHGSEWRNWLLYFSLPVLQGLIKEDALKPLEMLSRGAYLLSQDIISEDHITEAKDCFEQYLKCNQQEHGLENTKLNLHTLDHFARSVKELGNLWCYSTFNFESWNHRILKNISSPAGAILQIVIRHLIFMSLNSALYSSKKLSDPVKAQLFKLLEKRKLKNSIEVYPHIYVTGKCSQLVLSDEESDVLAREGCGNVTNVEQYKKIIVKSTPFKPAKPNSRSDNSMIYTYSNIFCSVQKIIKFMSDGESRCGILVNEHTAMPSPFEYAKHITYIKSEENDILHFIFPQDIRSSVVHVEVMGRKYVIPLPNLNEID